MRSRSRLPLLVLVLLAAILLVPARARLAGAAAAHQPTAPLAGTSAPSCAAPQWDLDTGGGVNLHCWNNIYVVSVDMRSPDVEVVPLEVNRPNSLSQLADRDTIAIINGDYTNNDCSGTACAQGLFSIAGVDKTNPTKLCQDALKRRVLAISADGHPAIDWWYAFVDHPQSRCSALRESGGWAAGARYHTISGGPQITFDGQYRWNAAGCTGSEYVINEEHFKCDAAGWLSGNQTVAGYTSDGNRLMFAVSNGSVGMQKVHDVLWATAQHHGQALQAAIKYDGGSKSGLFYARNPIFSIQPNIPVANAWVVRRRHAAPQPPAPPCAPTADQVALYSAVNFGGVCKALGIGDYADPGVFAPVGNDDARSIKVGANVRALLYQNGNFDPPAPTVLDGDVADLGAAPIGYNTSSLKVQSRTAPPAAPALAAPANGATLPAGASAGLAWLASGDQYYGELWGGSGIQQSFGWQSATSVELGALAPGAYSWHVKARNAAGESGWSDTWSFTIAAECAPGQLRAEYFNNRDLSGPPALAGCEDQIDHDWGAGSPGNGVNADGFTARWRGRFTTAAARYGFDLRADDGIRAFLDGAPLLDAWRDQSPTSYHVELDLAAGEHELVVEYYENSGGALAQVQWAPIGGATPGSWVADQWQDGSEFTLDGAVVHGGVRAARIGSAAENDARWTQHVAVAPHTLYVLSGWIKTDQVREDRVGASLGLVDDWAHTADLRGTQDWTFVQMAIDSGDRTDLWVGARLGHWNNTTTGTAWFDDLALQAIMPGCLGPNLLQQPGFE